MLEKFPNLEMVKSQLPSVSIHQDNYLITNESELFIDNFDKINSIDDINIENISNSNFFLFFHSDDEYLYHLDVIIKNNGKIIVQQNFHKYIYLHSNKNTRLAIIDNLNIMSSDDTAILKPPINMILGISMGAVVHGNICQALEQTKNINGDYIEIGVYRGGSCLTAFNYMKHANIQRKAYLLDTFDGFNYETAKTSPDIMWNNTHKLWGEEETMKKINNLLSNACPKQEFKLVKSNICRDNLPIEITKIAVANIDVDMYEATRDAINKVADKMAYKGIIICEDPTSTPALIGSFYAMEKFLESELGKNFMKIHVLGQYFLIKMN